MADSVPAALRERVSTRSVLAWLAVVALLYALLGSSPLQVALSVATAALLGLADLLTDVYDLRSEIESLTLGLVTVLGGAALVVFDGGPGTVGAAFLVVGSWLVLDAAQALRHEGLTESPTARDGHEVYQEYVTGRVHEAVREESRTRRELCDALDADEDAIEQGVATLLDSGAVVSEGSELRASADRRSRLERVRDGVTAGARRLARPVAVEFR